MVTAVQVVPAQEYMEVDAPPSVRSQSEPLPVGWVPQVVAGAPVPPQIVNVDPDGPMVMQGVPVPETAMCGFEVLLPGGVPPLVA
jgi:hypothetical protein